MKTEKIQHWLTKRFITQFRVACGRAIGPSFYFKEKPSSDSTSLVWYNNMILRSIPLRTRSVKYSKELRNNMRFNLTADITTEVRQIEQEALQGKDLNPRLSESLLDLSFDDMMFNDLGIHHMHLGTKIISSGFVERTGPLLYLLVKNGVCYFIDVLPHGHWADKELVHIIYNNWPELFNKPYGVVRMCNPTRWGKERMDLRDAGLLESILTLDNGEIVFALGAGYASSKDNAEAVRRTYQTLHAIREIAEKTLKKYKNAQRLSLRIRNSSVEIFDNKSKIVIHTQELVKINNN